MIRLHTVGSQIAFQLPVAKEAKFDDPTVRFADTPLEIEFYNQLQSRIIDRNLRSLECIASKAAAVLGHGFYTHDLLVESHSDQIYLCESEMQFLDWAHLNKLQPISDKIDGLQDFRDQHAAGKKSADCFLQYLTDFVPYDETSKVPAPEVNSDQIAQPAR